MKASDYFKKTFVFVFVFSFTSRIVFQLFDGLDLFSLKFFIKTLFVSLLTALVLGMLNYFLKFDFFNKNNKNNNN
jgi:hypothetical protein